MTAAVLGAAVALVVGHALRPRVRSARRPRLLDLGLALGRRWHRRAAATTVLAAAGVVAPVLPAVLALAWWTRRHLRAQRAHRVRAREVRLALPDVVDLLALATTAGLTLPIALPLVAQGAPPPLGPALSAAHRAATAGRARADALLEHLAPHGDRARAVADVLVDHLRYGVPLLPALERTSLELRLDRRRTAELEARRVPVRLLAPLVTCVLPAFGLLTVVPLLAASLDALPT